MPLDAMTEPCDEDLLRAYVAGDASAARALTLRLSPRVLGHATRLLGERSEAEDVTQEALLRLWRIAPDWRHGEAQISTWLWQVTANLCTDRLRKRGRAAPLDAAGDPADSAPSAAQRMQQASRASALEAALATLPERQRDAVRLRHIEGLGNPEIADILETSVEAVESLTARGCRALKAALANRRAELGFTDE
ncbi:RNA polymerase sigma factor [Roseobacteraceae bacterium S113]